MLDYKWVSQWLNATSVLKLSEESEVMMGAMYCFIFTTCVKCFLYISQNFEGPPEKQGAVYHQLPLPSLVVLGCVIFDYSYSNC